MDICSRRNHRLLAALAIVAIAACSSSGSDVTGSGGRGLGTGGAASSGGSGAGGSTGTGGTASVESGGSSGSGGKSGTGGSAGMGGGVASGGNSGTGGAIASGGSTGSGGGSSRDGGPADASSDNTGGVTGTGGARASGGATGTGVMASGGATGTGGVGSGGATGGTGSGGATTGGAPGFDPCPASGPCKVMPLGDSITDGTGFSGGYRVELFAKATADKKNITFVGSLSNGPSTVSGVTFPKSHEGHFGWTIKQVDDLIPDPALNPAPHIVLLHLGTNDINQNIASGAPDRLGSLVDQIIADLPGALVVVAKIIPEPSKASAIDTYNAAIPAVVKARADAGKHVILVDQFTGFPSSELGDGVHPNQAGYTRMAGVWYAAIKSYLH